MFIPLLKITSLYQRVCVVGRNLLEGKMRVKRISDKARVIT
jgi:hypothetical protein